MELRIEDWGQKLVNGASMCVIPILQLEGNRLCFGLCVYFCHLRESAYPSTLFLFWGLSRVDDCISSKVDEDEDQKKNRSGVVSK